MRTLVRSALLALVLAAACAGALALLVESQASPAFAGSVIASVGCSDGRGGVTPIEVGPSTMGGDPNCHSNDPRRKELCANRICDAWSAGSTAVYWN